jgi:glycosyltransferase involved in cell wall biosynthesis
MTRLLVDGVFFQLNNTGIARVWRMLLSLLARSGEYEIILLDRGNSPQIEGVHPIPFPSYRMGFHSPADSELIQKTCDHYRVDAFTSTYYTAPLSTPMVLVLYDMIPELFGFDLRLRDKMDKELAIAFAQRYLCISHMTRKDLLSFYPEIPPDRVAVAHCGVEEEVFRQREPGLIERFRDTFGLTRPYYLFVGSRVQFKGYKNSQLFFQALKRLQNSDFDVLCVGGEPQIEESILAGLPSGIRCTRVELTDDELAFAYGGAQALVYPSLYEGFGMPVIEAMASGCPVITTQHGSLAEAAGAAAHLISGFSVDEMADAILKVQLPEYRRHLIQAGLSHAQNFRWQGMADAMKAQLDAVIAEGRSERYADFFKQWRRLRGVQASVDFVSLEQPV